MGSPFDCAARSPLRVGSFDIIEGTIVLAQLGEEPRTLHVEIGITFGSGKSESNGLHRARQIACVLERLYGAHEEAVIVRFGGGSATQHRSGMGPVRPFQASCNELLSKRYVERIGRACNLESTFDSE